MSNPPKLIISIVVSATRILGKAFYEAGRQAVKNAQHRPQGVLGNDVAGVGNATSGSITDQLTRQHRMTLDEAHMILNTKPGEALEQVLKHYEHLFKANSPLPPPPKPQTAQPGKSAPLPGYSHYLQSKVVRARERIEAELKVPEVTLESTMQPGATALKPGSGAEATTTTTSSSSSSSSSANPSR